MTLTRGWDKYKQQQAGDTGSHQMAEAYHSHGGAGVAVPARRLVNHARLVLLPATHRTRLAPREVLKRVKTCLKHAHAHMFEGVRHQSEPWFEPQPPQILAESQIQ